MTKLYQLITLVALTCCIACSTTKLKIKKENNDSVDQMPPLSKVEASCVEVPARIEGNKFIKKHEVCTIERGSVWMME